MYARELVPESLTRLAALQAQVVTREQAVGLGLGRRAIDRLVTSSQWQRLAPGTYLTHHLTPDWDARAWAGVLVGGDLARVGGRAAGFLHQLLDEAPERIDILVPVGHGTPRSSGWSFHREVPGLRQEARYGSPPRISVEDAVLDIVAVEDREDRVIALVTNAIGQRHTTVPRLRRALARRQRIRHRVLLEKLVADVAEGAHSNLEIGYLRDVERAHGLPRGERQARRGRTYCDVCYRRFGVLVELDGRVGHVGAHRDDDMSRDNSAVSQGLATLRYGHAHVFGAPCDVAHEVGGNLTLRGWQGLLQRCRRCRRVQ